MKVTFLGTGTSQGIPVITCSCIVCRSADHKDKRLRVSVLVETDDKTIVIDSGPDFRYQMLRAGVKDLDAIVFTHEHKDHVAGLDDIRPFNYLLKKNIDIYAVERVQHALRREFSYIFAEAHYPGLPQIDLHTINDETFYIGNTAIVPLDIMHYKLPILGFRIGDFTYITDAKTIPDATVEKIKGTRVLVVNALQKEQHISHFTLAEAIEFAEKIGAETTYFTHISHNLGLHEHVEKDLPPNIKLAYDGLTILSE
ncbi:phosphoribosyl 1,2-cyclic phosphate phosphodiesterase [Pedobacter africanus]|uniref:Phosphoribosyl 1,2-cyclic phosphate phosphodiesterase n=1 Tax=Pedobacter africanus TaxID=151894 RepID=A0ACC6L0P9_9SPHI|nr:MBL fold metallo-hydrolase [Pedobacter africanus]MDR6784942.1 phosphoribosyl 1,2-cyclic phosphate phosphodiesterase [Pedobacter africanus]